VALLGAGVTVVLLFLWVPEYGYAGAAWTHLVSYGVMVTVSYLLGRRFYPVPYDVGRLLAYVAAGVAILALARWLTAWQLHWALSAVAGLSLFGLGVWWFDGRNLVRQWRSG